MLADAREHPALGRPTTIHLDRQDGQTGLTAVREDRRPEAAVGGQVRVVEHLLGLADRCERQTGALEDGHQIRPRVAL